MHIHISSYSSEKREWVVVTMVIYPLPLVWGRRWVVVVMGILEREGVVLMAIHIPSSSKRGSGWWSAWSYILFLLFGKGNGC